MKRIDAQDVWISAYTFDKAFGCLPRRITIDGQHITTEPIQAGMIPFRYQSMYYWLQRVNGSWQIAV